MATLIPYAISNEASWAERELFDIIKNDDRMKNWTVFHSLMIEEHNSQFKGGEADFVIIAPNLGCFVIEVKGGGDKDREREVGIRGSIRKGA